MADSTMVICKFHHRRVHRASFLGNLNTYPTRDNCWNVCGICHSRNSIRVHRVRLAVKKKIDPKFAQTPHPPHKVKTAVVQAVVKGNFPVLTTPGSHYRMDVAGCSWKMPSVPRKDISLSVLLEKWMVDWVTFSLTSLFFHAGV